MRTPRLRPNLGIEAAAMLGLVILAVALRLPDLAAIPPEVHGDEAAIGVEARRLIDGTAPSVFAVGWYHVPYLSFAIPVPFLLAFGNDLYGLRMASAFLGVLSVPLLYLVARSLFTPRVAFLAAFFMAVSQWHVHFSRTGFHYMQALFAELLLFFFLFQGIRSRRVGHYFLAGLAAGLCLEVYFASRLAPLLAALYLAYRGATERGFLRQQHRGLVALALGALVFLAPMAPFFARNPATLLTRTEGVFLLTSRNLEHSYDAHGVDNLADVLRRQARDSLEAFNLKGETSLQYARRGPLLDPWTGPLFVLGLAVVTLRPTSARHVFVAAWFWVTLVAGSVLTVDALFAPRLVGIIPALGICAALALDAGWRGLEALLPERRPIARRGRSPSALPSGELAEAWVAGSWLPRRPFVPDLARGSGFGWLLRAGRGPARSSQPLTSGVRQDPESTRGGEWPPCLPRQASGEGAGSSSPPEAEAGRAAPGRVGEEDRAADLEKRQQIGRQEYRVLGRVAGAALAAAFLTLAASASYHEYFGEHVVRAQPAGFYTALARHAAALGDGSRVYLISHPDTSLRYDTVRFLVPGLDGVDLGAEPLALSVDQPPATRGVVFVFEAAAPVAEARLAEVKRAYPKGREQVHRSATGEVLFTSYRLEPAGTSSPGR